jgi:hypothetical protein
MPVARPQGYDAHDFFAVDEAKAVEHAAEAVTKSRSMQRSCPRLPNDAIKIQYAVDRLRPKQNLHIGIVDSKQDVIRLRSSLFREREGS